MRSNASICGRICAAAEDVPQTTSRASCPPPPSFFFVVSLLPPFREHRLVVVPKFLPLLTRQIFFSVMIAPRLLMRVASSVSQADVKYACATRGMSSRRSTTRVYPFARSLATRRRLDVPGWARRAPLGCVCCGVGDDDSIRGEPNSAADASPGKCVGTSISFEKSEVFALVIVCYMYMYIGLGLD